MVVSAKAALSPFRWRLLMGWYRMVITRWWRLPSLVWWSDLFVERSRLLTTRKNCLVYCCLVGDCRAGGFNWLLDCWAITDAGYWRWFQAVWPERKWFWSSDLAVLWFRYSVWPLLALCLARRQYRWWTRYLRYSPSLVYSDVVILFQLCRWRVDARRVRWVRTWNEACAGVLPVFWLLMTIVMVAFGILRCSRKTVMLRWYDLIILLAWGEEEQWLSRWRYLPSDDAFMVKAMEAWCRGIPLLKRYGACWWKVFSDHSFRCRIPIRYEKGLLLRDALPTFPHWWKTRCCWLTRRYIADHATGYFVIVPFEISTIYPGDLLFRWRIPLLLMTSSTVPVYSIRGHCIAAGNHCWWNALPSRGITYWRDTWPIAWCGTIPLLMSNRFVTSVVWLVCLRTDRAGHYAGSQAAVVDLLCGIPLFWWRNILTRLYYKRTVKPGCRGRLLADDCWLIAVLLNRETTMTAAVKRRSYLLCILAFDLVYTGERLFI